MSGVDVFRFNLSDGSHADHGERFKVLRALEQETGRLIGILADPQGPKLCVGTFAGGPACWRLAGPFRLHLDAAPGKQRHARLPHPEIFAARVPAAKRLLNDGEWRPVVERCGAAFAQTRVLVGGKLSERKGATCPGLFCRSPS